MKYTNLLFVSFCFLFLASCSDNVEDENKIDGNWKLESISGGIAGGLPFEGEITIEVNDDDLDLYKDGALIMNGDLSYSKNENDQIFIDLDETYLTEEPEFRFYFINEIIVNKATDNSTLSLWNSCADCHSYNFIKN